MKTSITLPKELVDEIDRQDSNRSAFLERAARVYLNQISRSSRNARDLQILNERSDSLNAEAADVLDYQNLS